MSAHAVDRRHDPIVAIITVAWCAARSAVRTIDDAIDILVPILVLAGASLALPLAAMPS